MSEEEKQKVQNNDQNTQAMDEEKNINPENDIDSPADEGTEQNASAGKADEMADKLEQDLAEAKDKYLRLYSEFENFRRRNAKERIEMIKTAGKDIISELLPVLDDFERAQNAANQENADLEDLKKGYELIQNKMMKVMEDKGLKKMQLKPGDNFDSDFHEAITQTPAEDKFKGKIVDVIEPGYLLEDKVIRFAKVVIGA